MSSPTEGSIELRLERLERGLKRYRAAGALAVLVMLSALVAMRQDEGTKKLPFFPVLRAQRIEVADGPGAKAEIILETSRSCTRTSNWKPVFGVAELGARIQIGDDQDDLEASLTDLGLFFRNEFTEVHIGADKIKLTQKEAGKKVRSRRFWSRLTGGVKPK